MDVFVLFVCNSRANLHHCRTKRAVVKTQNLQHAMFHLGALKWQNLILLYIRLVDMQVNAFCLSVLKRATGSKLSIDFVERWLPCLNE